MALLTMKFMQRAVASSPASTPSTPPSQDQSNKRRKVAHNDTPSQNVDTLVNQAAIRAAIAEEEKKVESAIIKRAEELGDARWVLDVPGQKKGHPVPTPLRVVQVGFAEIDSFGATENDADAADTLYDSVPALRRYNMDKKKIPKKSHNQSSDSSDGSDSDSEESSSEETTGRQSFGAQSRNDSTVRSTARTTLKSKKSAEQLKAMQFSERRRKKEVKLNNPKGGISSISSGGGPSPRQPVSLTCFRCNQPGHRAVDCKKPGSRQAR
ncbi:hypothetical protein RRF57_007698 [Xylaria bambusicola]|uniref:CCHC-type domain-containing protein n=1 Tax=Xylaria bambusicola TaxID=326684 RepID=A0AAN7V0W9_9PEZI